MTAPPGALATSEPRVEQISAESDTDLSTRTKQMRYLCAELGYSRPQAHAILRDFEVARQRDQERPLVTAGATYSASFLRYLMRAPGVRNRPVLKHQWRTTS